MAREFAAHDAEQLARTMEETETLPADPIVGEWAIAVRALAARSPQNEDHGPRCVCGRQTYCREGGPLPGEPSCKRGTSRPQGEDHEAGIEAMVAALHEVFRDYGANLARLNPNDLEVVAARLSRVSPSRDGSVAEIERLRDRNAALERALGLAADEDLGMSRDGSVAVEDVVAFVRRIAGIEHTARSVADAIEREFSPASTGDRASEQKPDGG